MAYREPAHGPAPTNALALASAICGALAWLGVPFVAALAAVIMGHAARRQIAERGEEGASLALAGLVLGYANLVVLGAALLFAALVAVGWVLVMLL
ncbi:MAG: DUF4190 domain-containing protein [Sandaracinaceae bacterium]